MSDAVPSAFAAELIARIARQDAEIDILRRGGRPTDLSMLGAITVVYGRASLLAHEVVARTSSDRWLAGALACALGGCVSAKSLGKRLTKLAGPYVKREGRDGRAGTIWGLDPILETFAPPKVAREVADDLAA